MKIKKSGMLIALSLAASWAHAQTETIEYQSDAIKGTSTYLPNGFICPTQGCDLPTQPVIGSISGSITLDGSVSDNDLSLSSYEFQFVGTNGTPIVLEASGIYEFPGVDFGVSTSGDSITGFYFDSDSSPYHAPVTDFSISTTTGASIFYLLAGTYGTCENLVIGYGTPVTYAGSTLNPCSVHASSSTAGAFEIIPAPEIDPASLTSGITFLFGAVVILKKQNPNRTTKSRISFHTCSAESVLQKAKPSRDFERAKELRIDA